MLLVVAVVVVVVLLWMHISVIVLLAGTNFNLVWWICCKYYLDYTRLMIWLLWMYIFADTGKHAQVCCSRNAATCGKSNELGMLNFNVGWDEFQLRLHITQKKQFWVKFPHFSKALPIKCTWKMPHLLTPWGVSYLKILNYANHRHKSRDQLREWQPCFLTARKPLEFQVQAF